SYPGVVVPLPCLRHTIRRTMPSGGSMTLEPGSPESATSDRWPVLDANERRVLGVLIEKAKTTPDSYPMSVNGLVTGSNQKSNREPVMNLTDLDVEDTLTRLQKKGLITRIIGGRAERFRHEIDE